MIAMTESDYIRQHAITIRVTENTARAECDCGWSGPTHKASRPTLLDRARARAEHDRFKHTHH